MILRGKEISNMPDKKENSIKSQIIENRKTQNRH